MVGELKEREREGFPREAPRENRAEVKVSEQEGKREDRRRWKKREDMGEEVQWNNLKGYREDQ